MNVALQEQYKVRGYPTMLYVDPAGEVIKENDLGNTDVGPMSKEFENIAKKHPGRPSVWQTRKAATRDGKKAKKPVVVYYVSKDADLARMNAKLMKEIGGDRLKKFAWALVLADPDRLKIDGIEAVPAAVVVDSQTESVLSTHVVREGDKADALNGALDEALKSAKGKKD
jgi:hypothetical protein